MEISLGGVTSVIKEPALCPKWQYKCIYKLRLTKNYIYKLSNLPWPLNDRYTVMKSEEFFNAETKTHTINLKNIRRDL
jgi:hypothetical protein